MTWHQRLDILRWRSLEEADATGEMLSVEKRREATARSRGDLRATHEKPLDIRVTDPFFQKRATWLGAEVPGDKMRLTLASMTVPQGRWWWAFAGWLVALVVGFGLTGIGAEREINLLALPLVGLLLWNLSVMILAVIFELMPNAKRSESGGPLVPAIFRFLHKTDDEDGSVYGVTFRRYALPLAMARFRTRVVGWLHVAAAVLALGCCVGMYAKGWSHEYRAVWESTLLTKASQAETFFSTLFWPASKTLNISVPVQDLALMQRIDGKVERSAAALPWINLYAATLFLLIVVPRLLLAVWTQSRGDAQVQRLWVKLGWDALANRLLRSVEGGDEMVQVLLHGVADNAERRSLWECEIREKIGGMARLDFQTIPSGEEDEFAAAWAPQTHVVIALFQLATTPEEEVQRTLIKDLRGRLHRRFADGKLIAFIDGSGVQSRWTKEHIESRHQLWMRTLKDEVDEMDFIGDSINANPLRVRVSKAR